MAYSSQHTLSMGSCPSNPFNALQTFLHRANANNQQQQIHHRSFSLPYQHAGMNGSTYLVAYVDLFQTMIQQQYILPMNINLNVDTNQAYPIIEANDCLMRELLNHIMLFKSQLNHQQGPDHSMNKVSQPSVTQEKNSVRNTEYRCDKRGRNVSGDIIRIQKRAMQCRRDIGIFGPAFVSVYESLIPSSEERAKQSKLISSLNKVICKEWPHARLHVYGSCVNNFGMANCDVDLCLSIDTYLNKRELIPKLAKILEAAGLRIIQALPRARVPIVKMMDPETGLSCDICSNNLLAIVNTKLLKDYAIIDPRLRQLAIIVKHWAKSRRVNETYQGTLSSYAYVIMCIHYLQIHRPTILPCLQAMEPTYVTTIDNKEYRYHDKVQNLRGPSAWNQDSIARLVWGFFHYWAYQHDYTSDVISIRTGSVISKHEKGWIKPKGYDEHLICIEDPFDTTHDLGRVVDKSTIKILREEFERAANIMQYDLNPIKALFEKYVPPPKVEEDFGDQCWGWGSIRVIKME